MWLLVAWRYGWVACLAIIPAWADSVICWLYIFQWKKYLTIMLNVHFTLCVIIAYFGSESNVLWCSNLSDVSASPAYFKFASTYWPELPSLGSCQMTESGAFFACAILSSYLLLFTYKKIACGKKPITNGHTNDNVWGYFDVCFWSSVNGIVNAGSKKIKNAHRENVHVNGCIGHWQGCWSAAR